MFESYSRSVKTVHCHVWTVPLVKSFFEALANVSGAVMSPACWCGKETPAGPDDGPLGSSPRSSYRARAGADALAGFRTCPVVHITSPSTSMPIALRRNFSSMSPFVQAATGRSSYWPPLVISGAALALPYADTEAMQFHLDEFCGGRPRRVAA